MAYSVGLERRAQKQIARLAPGMQDRVEAALKPLANDPAAAANSKAEKDADRVSATTGLSIRWTTSDSK